MSFREADFGMDGVEEKDSFYLRDGEALLNTLDGFLMSERFSNFSLDAYDEFGNDYVFECWGAKLFDRYGTTRLYLSMHDPREESGKWHLYFLAKQPDGDYLIMLEKDQNILNTIADDETTDDRDAYSQPEKKKGNGWKIFFSIILFPFWLLWQFIKALLSLFNIAVGDSSAFQAFKDGFNGDSSADAYTFTNEMGCEETVYTRDGRNFYHSDGSYAGSSDDMEHLRRK